VIHAVDFDGTITTEDRWPECGPINEEAVEAMRLARTMGDTIIIHTCRAGIPLLKMTEFLVLNRVPFDSPV
jgi:hydroxymethylpyrimidine pyrophosphatase-like HAD family hydrolase